MNNVLIENALAQREFIANRKHDERETKYRDTWAKQIERLSEVAIGLLGLPKDMPLDKEFALAPMNVQGQQVRARIVRGSRDGELVIESIAQRGRVELPLSQGELGEWYLSCAEWQQRVMDNLFTAAARGNENDFRVYADQVIDFCPPERMAEARAGIGRVLAERRAEWEKGVAEKEQREKAAAEREMSAARTVRAEWDKEQADHLQRVEQYNRDCKVWAEAETARAWKPWTVYVTRYVPEGNVRIDAGCDDSEVENHGWSLVATRGLMNDPASGGWNTDTNGRTVRIGSILDVERIEFKSPSTTEAMDWHTAQWAGKSVVNCSPEMPKILSPSPAIPVPPATWRDFAEAHGVTRRVERKLELESN